jgi:hypothetical protein
MLYTTITRKDNLYSNLIPHTKTQRYSHYSFFKKVNLVYVTIDIQINMRNLTNKLRIKNKSMFQKIILFQLCTPSLVE